MKKLWIIIFISVILRLVLSLTTFHTDIQAFNISGKIIAAGNILTFYDYLPALPVNDPIKNLAVFNYPPAIYLYHGVFNFLFGNVLGLSQVNQFIVDNSSNYGDLQFNIHLLLLKLPYLIFDLLAGFILFKLFDSTKKSITAFTLWMFNPINLYTTYMMGQFDVMPTFFILLSVFLIVKNKLNWAALALGFGIALKLFPLFLIIPLLILGKNYWEKAKLVVLSAIPYIVLIIPYLFSHGFRSVALFTNQNSKSLYANIPVSGEEALILFPATLVFFYIFIWRNKQVSSYLNKTKLDIWKLFLIPLLLFFIFTHFHPQWLLWVTPFLIFDLVENEFKNIIPNLLILLSWFGSLFFFEPGLNINIFAPLIPVLHNMPSIWIILQLKIDYNLARSLLQTIFAASSFYLIYEYFPRKKFE